MYLFLDAADNSGKITVALFVAQDKKIKILKKISSKILAEDILVLLDKILKQTELTAADFKGVVVTVGPGPYTALRVSLSIGNSLAYGLKIPIAGVGKEENLEKMISEGLRKLGRVKVGKYVTKIKMQKLKIN
jgi:tRNA threonylcarbamoyladenosine biosynthesis protein TsaB